MKQELRNRALKPGTGNWFPGPCQGASLIELLIVIGVLALFVTIVSTSAGRFDDDVKYAVALKDMKALQTALVEGVYADLGYIPCGTDASTTDDESRRTEALFIPAYLFMERSEIMAELGKLDCLKEGYVSEFEKYQGKGWRGPYLKTPSGLINATYFDPERFTATSGKDVYLDAMATPWADDCEELAQEAEDGGDSDLALEYRKGKYYQVLYPQMTRVTPVMGGSGIFDEWEAPVCEIPRNMGYILSRGPDCLPPEAPGTDLADCFQCLAQIRENAVSDDECGEIKRISSYYYAKVGSVAGMRACVAEKYEQQHFTCYEDGEDYTLAQRLAKDAEDPLYMDIGDDLIMSLSGKIIRGALDD